MARDPYQELGVLRTASAGEIRKAFLLFSQSAVRASQGGASFSRTAAGGFGA